MRLQALDVHVHVVPDLFSLSFPNATLDGLGGIPVIDLGQPSCSRLASFLETRCFDVLAAGALLLLLSPVLMVVAARDQDGVGRAGVSFGRNGLGENGKTFSRCSSSAPCAITVTPVRIKAHVQRLIEENLDPSALNGTGMQKS